MKALAILKDSLREAIDTKVFYVMVGLSCLVTLFTLTLSFQPRPGENFMKLMVLGMYGDLQDLDPEHLMQVANDPKFKAYEVKGSEPVDGAADGPSSPYTVTIVAHAQNAAEAARTAGAPAEIETKIRQRFGMLDDLKLLDVTDVRLGRKGDPFVPDTMPDKEVYFVAKVQPTSAARRLWPHEPSLFFGAIPMSFLGELPLGLQLYIIEDQVVGGIGAWVSILISVIITAFFIPNMLRKGTVDLLLVKPIHRSSLLLYKYLGGLIFILLNTGIVVVGVWLALGLRSGIWAPSFLLMIFVLTFFFAILYAASTFFGVLTRSPIASILLTCALWFGLFIVGLTYQVFESRRVEEERRNVPAAERWSDNWFGSMVRAIHFVTPRTKDLDQLSSQLLIRDLLTANQIKAQKINQTRINWGESLTVSGVFIAVMLGLSCWWFATRDY